ncbi:hypothetical protein [Sphingobacterium multivorum]|uniref:hypothetical protein n=1 Tax=Sphingobacterium multivorum TaxID=28454 RepID=UPI00345E6EF3
MKYIIYVSLLLVFFFSCSQEGTKKQNPSLENVMQVNEHRAMEDSLWRKALNEGNFQAYNEISNNYLLNLKESELYYYSLIMANKYNCPEAYLHLYTILTKSSNFNGIEMVSDDSTTKNLSMFYLVRAYELGDDKAKYIVDKHYGKNKAPLSKKFLEEIINNMPYRK